MTYNVAMWRHFVVDLICAIKHKLKRRKSGRYDGIVMQCTHDDLRSIISDSGVTSRGAPLLSFTIFIELPISEHSCTVKYPKFSVADGISNTLSLIDIPF